MEPQGIGHNYVKLVKNYAISEQNYVKMAEVHF